LNLVYEWLDLHKDELMQNWKRMENKEAIVKIDPFSVDWNNEIGFAPEFLYENGVLLTA